MAKKTTKKTTKKKTATGSVNKAAEIRRLIEQMGIDSRTKDIVEALEKRGIKVPSASVSIEKSKLRGGPKKRAVKKKKASSNRVTFSPAVDVFGEVIEIEQDQVRDLCVEVYGERVRDILRACKGDVAKAKAVLRMI